MASLILISSGSTRPAYYLPKASYIIGRDPASQLFLPGPSVSRHHATILFNPEGNFILRDEGSTNGSFVNGEKIAQRTLVDHDTLRFGDYLFLVDLSEKRKLPTPSKPRLVTLGDQKDRPADTLVLSHPEEKISGLSGGRSQIWIWAVGVFVLFWAVVLGIGWPMVHQHVRPAATAPSLRKEAPIVPPVVSAPGQLVRGAWTWAPSPEAHAAIYSTVVKLDSVSLGAASGTKDKQKAMEEFRNAWEHGLVVCEPTFERIEKDGAQGDAVHFVLEDCLSKPTFWDFNSTVLPEKRAVMGSFYVPGLTNSLYFIRNPRLTAKIAKFNSEEFPWHLGERGVTWPMSTIKVDWNKDLGRLRWLAILKVQPVSSRMVLHTLEGDLLRNTPKEYPLSVFPAEVLAEVLYIDSAPAPLQVRLNPALAWEEDSQNVSHWISTHFKEILAAKPLAPMEVPTVFHLPAEVSAK